MSPSDALSKCWRTLVNSSFHHTFSVLDASFLLFQRFFSQMFRYSTFIGGPVHLEADQTAHRAVRRVVINRLRHQDARSICA